MKTRFTSLLFFVLSLFTVHFSYAQYQFQSACSQLVWEDNFDGTSLDATKWTPQIGDGCDINLCGWGNNEAQYYTDRSDNVKVENGKLIITALKEDYNGKSYTSARIRSKDKGDFTFGRIEARIKLPEGAGSWPAFWMLPTDEVYGPWPQSGEIDIMEFQGKTPTFVSGTAHYGGSLSNHNYRGLVKYLPSGQYYYDDFHDFAIEWDSTTIRWYMDGSLYHTLKNDDIAPANWPFDQRFHLILNNAIGGNLGGTVNDASFPQVMEVDYVRVYSVPLNRSVRGKARVYEDDQEVAYHIPGDPTNVDTYLWSLPSGATITDGQGTEKIKVNWGDVSSSGNVHLRLTKTCDVFELDFPVQVYQDACSVTIENFQTDRNMTFKQSTGTYNPLYANPLSNAVNSSSLVGRYRRNNEESYDAIIFKDVLLDDVVEYESGEKVLYLDLYTNAPVGTMVYIQFQNSSKAHGNLYPAGVRNTFLTTTTVRNSWERHLFYFSQVNDPTVLSTEIDELAIRFDPGNNTASVYYFDNLKRDKTGSECFTTAIGEEQNEFELVCYPNPARDRVMLDFGTHQVSQFNVLLCDAMGNVILNNKVEGTSYRSHYEMNVQSLKSGTYYLHIVTDGQSFVKQFVKL